MIRPLLTRNLPALQRPASRRNALPTPSAASDPCLKSSGRPARSLAAPLPATGLHFYSDANKYPRIFQANVR